MTFRRRFVPSPVLLSLVLCLSLVSCATSDPAVEPADASVAPAAPEAPEPPPAPEPVGPPLELETIELPERLALVRTYLLAGDWLNAVQANRRFRQGLSWPDDLLAVSFAFEALAEQELGRQVESVCLGSMGRFLRPALDRADFGALPTFDEPETVEIDETVTPPRPASIWRKAPVGPQDVEPVVLRMVIDTEGKIAGITVRSGERSLVLRTLATICRATYHPATKNGEPVAVAITVRPADGPERVVD